MSKENCIVELIQKLPKATERRLNHLEGMLDAYLLIDEGYGFDDFPQSNKNQEIQIRQKEVN